MTHGSRTTYFYTPDIRSHVIFLVFPVILLSMYIYTGDLVYQELTVFMSALTLINYTLDLKRLEHELIEQVQDSGHRSAIILAILFLLGGLESLFLEASVLELGLGLLALSAENFWLGLGIAVSTILLSSFLVIYSSRRITCFGEKTWSGS